MIKFDISYKNQLNEIEGMIKSVVNLLSFPGSEYLNSEIISSDIQNLKHNVADNSLIELIDNIYKIYIESDAQKLMIDYAKLFVGPYQVLAPPYGSYYLEEGKLMGDTTIEVNQYYQNAGLSINESFKDLPDHVIAELEFLVFLIFNEKNYYEKKDFDNLETIFSYRYEFFNKYVLSWVNKFAVRIIENANSEFYKNVANYLMKIIEQINGKLNQVL